ncbi:hypothetical protein EGR_07947 [Echinococcus granulosus]|uniref:Uncharacterized protein n=1 Tax=Echinococcus granulosus TaxID=6210 RepID=W6U7I5_ECHGR|nr:hypothetical protein EGR_07947 [Echinococcus granulosus]EUB57198.1 hypothetical protein EGR_07947 [Echinococcus granulosus]
MVVGNTGVLLTLHNLKITTADNEPHYTNPFSTADILFTISFIICALFTAEVVIRLLITGRRVIRLPIDYRATVAHYQQDESFRQHNLNSMQHRLDINELELQQLRQYVYANRGLVPPDCLSHDFSTNSETVDSDQFCRLHDDLQDLRCCPLNEEPDEESGSGMSKFSESSYSIMRICCTMIWCL